MKTARISAAVFAVAFFGTAVGLALCLSLGQALAAPDVMPRPRARQAAPTSAPISASTSHDATDPPVPRTKSVRRATDKPPPQVPPAAVASGTAGAKPPIVMGVKVGERAGTARFAIEMSDPVSIRTFTLTRPDRVVFDMPAVQWKAKLVQKPKPGGLIRSYRYGQYRPGHSRFVIDLNAPAVVASPKVLLPQGGYGYRLLVDLEPVSRSRFDKTAGWPADLKARELAADKAMVATVAPEPRNTRKTVVLDPGHGGIDDGTVGVGGVREKDVVLAETGYVKAALQARGYRVFVTHETDEFIPLQQRVAIARARKADLFISIHADSIHDPAISGLSIYTLSEKGSDQEARMLAAKENQSDVLAGVDLGGQNAGVAPILIDLAQRDSLNKSSRFAEAALGTLKSVTPILPRQPHRSAALVVLKAPDMPAVLIELGYLSNAADAARMLRPAWRKSVAEAIAAAADRYFADPSGAATVSGSVSGGISGRKRTTPP